MATPPVSDEELRRTVEAYEASGRNQSQTALALGVSRTGLQGRLHMAARRGLMGTAPVLPGFEIKSIASKDAGGAWVRQVKEPGEVYEVPAGHTVKGESALLDSDGRVLNKWVKTREGERSIEDVVEALKGAFEGFEGWAAPSIRPSATAHDLLTLYPLADFHLGMFAWEQETGQNWDLKIAENVIGEALEDVVARSPRSAKAVVLGGGDLVHSDNQENRTSRSGNPLDVDGRYAKIIMAANRLVVRQIDAALSHHDEVTVRILRGNHDEHASIAVAYFLLAWYRNEPRVSVDVDQSLFWWCRFGSVMLGATHGHEAKIADMPGIMAHRRAEEWGRTRHRYAHGFHIHHKTLRATEGGGVVMETHQTPIPQDAWHFGAGFLSGRSMTSITYHRDFGEVSRVRRAILDGAPG